MTFISTMKQFYEKKKQFIPGNTAKKRQNLGISFLLTCLHVTIANGQIEWSESTDFNRIQDGAWLESSCV